MQKLKDFLMHSYHADKLNFYLDILSTVLLIGASATLAYTAYAFRISGILYWF
jgi:hypothetical protein